MILDEGDDFSSNDLLLTFVSGAAPDTQCISIDVVDDVDFEESQNFSVSIMTISPPIAAAGEFATVMIQDSNGIAIIAMCKSGKMLTFTFYFRF